MTVIRYRCSGLVTSSTSFWYGRPVGTKTTSSRSKVAWTSLAATRWPWWMGSKVPPMTPRSEERRVGKECVAWVEAAADEIQIDHGGNRARALHDHTEDCRH